MIFQLDSPLVIEAFKAGNYSIEFNNEIEYIENNLCVIYFSSNEIYYPDTVASFEYYVLKRDKYEWKHNKFPKAKKHIFLRDLNKQWYLNGINNTLNNPEKVLNFLINETIGYQVITVGSSAGGYAALLFGSLLKCVRIYAFNAQLNLKLIMKNTNSDINPILFSKVKEKDFEIFYDLTNFLTNKIDNYYFQSCYSKADIEQYDGISNGARGNLKVIRFRTSNHGFPFLRINLPIIFSLNSSQLDQYINKNYHPIIFSIRLIGFFATFIFVFKAVNDRIQKIIMIKKFMGSLNNYTI